MGEIYGLYRDNGKTWQLLLKVLNTMTGVVQCRV